jgi:hypothetical protein
VAVGVGQAAARTAAETTPRLVGWWMAGCAGEVYGDRYRDRGSVNSTGSIGSC